MFKKIIFLLVLTFFLFVVGLLLQIPSAKTIRGCLKTKMYEVNLCPKSPQYVYLKSISPFLIKAILMSEDSTFFQHKGFNWQSIQKSAEENWRLGKFNRGGSTISQQLAKNMFLTKEKTLTRKLQEALITYKIEDTLSKREILERYLNVIEFGQDLFGIKAAAHFYFNKSPSQLSAVEAAFLAMILPNPTKYSRSYFKKELTPFAKKRISRILRDLYRYQQISESEYAQALVEFENFLGTPPPPPAEDNEEDLEIDSES